MFATQTMRRQPEGDPGEVAKASCRIRGVPIVLRPAIQERVDARDQVRLWDVSVSAEPLHALFEVSFSLRRNRQAQPSRPIEVALTA